MKKLFILAAMLLVGAGCQPEESVSSMGIIDMHAHINPTSEAINDAFIDDLAVAAKKSGVSKIVLGLNARQVPDRPPTYSTQHDEWVLRAAERYPDLIIPALNGFDPSAPESVDYVRTQLATGKWKIVGELDLRNSPKKTTNAADDSDLAQIFDLAGAAGVPVMIHFDFAYGMMHPAGQAELEAALSAHPQTKFIFAHTCGENIIDLMDTHQNLYCEHEHGPLPVGTDLNRVLVGTDIQMAGPRSTDWQALYEQKIAALRSDLSDLSASDLESVLRGNAVKLGL